MVLKHKELTEILRQGEYVIYLGKDNGNFRSC